MPTCMYACIHTVMMRALNHMGGSDTPNPLVDYTKYVHVCKPELELIGTRVCGVLEAFPVWGGNSESRGHFSSSCLAPGSSSPIMIAKRSVGLGQGAGSRGWGGGWRGYWV